MISNSPESISYGDQTECLAHPRTGGTFSKVPGKYVREDVVTCQKTGKYCTDDAVLKDGHKLGTVFDPNKIIDKGTFENGPAFSEGIEYVIVNGAFALKNGKTVDNVFPGKPVYGKFNNNG